MDICIDFDGTCVTHEFPKIGKDIGAIPVLNKLVKEGHNLILLTMRSDLKNVISNDPKICKEGGNYLTKAIMWFANNKIPLYGININPIQSTWTTSSKVYGDLYIDDHALGCPLVYDTTISKHPFVDWKKVEILLKKDGIIKE